MKKLSDLFDPRRPWLLMCVLVPILWAMFAPDVRAADAPTQYQVMINTAKEIQAGQNGVLTEYARAQTKREEEKPAALLACSQMKNEVTQALCVLGVNGNLSGGGGVASMPQLAGVNLPAPPPEPEGWGSKAWNGFLAVADRGLAFMGVRENRRAQVDLAQINAGVSIAQSNNQLGMVLGLSNGQTQLGLGAVQAVQAVALKPDAPGVVVSNNTGPVQVGNGQLTFAPITGSYNPQYPLTRCTTNAAGVQTCTGP